MDITDLKPGMLVADGRELLQVSSVYPTYITAQLMLRKDGKPPARTAVRTYTAMNADLYLSAPSNSQIARYEAAWLPNKKEKVS